MSNALKEARDQVRAALLRCPARSAELDRRASKALVMLDAAERTGTGYAAAVAEIASLLAALETERIEQGRQSRMTQQELFPRGR